MKCTIILNAVNDVELFRMMHYMTYSKVRYMPAFGQLSVDYSYEVTKCIKHINENL